MASGKIIISTVSTVSTNILYKTGSWIHCNLDRIMAVMTMTMKVSKHYHPLIQTTKGEDKDYTQYLGMHLPCKVVIKTAPGVIIYDAIL